MEEIIRRLEDEVKQLFGGESTGHDIYHLKRVMNNALMIQEKEGGDRLIIAVAAFLHDVHHIIEKETGKDCHPKDSLFRIKEMLDGVNLTDGQKNKILFCIENHEMYRDSSEENIDDIETLILQDADLLDAIGAIGVGRTFMYHGANGDPMWIPEKSFDRKNYDESVKDVSAIHHFHSKLLKVKDDMNTETGKRIAEKRSKFMELFVEEFFDEWNGKK